MKRKKKRKEYHIGQKVTFKNVEGVFEIAPIVEIKSVRPHVTDFYVDCSEGRILLSSHLVL